jgi:hypothetical protein
VLIHQNDEGDDYGFKSGLCNIESPKRYSNLEKARDDAECFKLGVKTVERLIVEHRRSRASQQPT